MSSLLSQLILKNEIKPIDCFSLRKRWRMGFCERLLRECPRVVLLLLTDSTAETNLVLTPPSGIYMLIINIDLCSLSEKYFVKSKTSCVNNSEFPYWGSLMRRSNIQIFKCKFYVITDWRDWKITLYWTR